MSSSPSQNMQEIFRKIALENDEKAFSVFFDQYHARLLRFAKFYLRSIEEAEDVVSDVLIKMLKHRKDTFSKNNFIGYLFTSIKNGCLDQIKKNNKYALNHDSSYDDKDYFVFHNHNPLNQLIHSELTRILRDRIEALPPKRQMVFKFIKDDQMSYKQVADLMEISERTVEVHLKLALKDIREVLDTYLNRSGLDSPNKIIVSAFIGALVGVI